MLDKMKAWGKAAYNEIESTLGGDEAEHERLAHMRKRLEGNSSAGLNLNDVRTTTRPNRRGFAHWFLKPKSGEVAREEVYNDVLQKLAAGRSAGTLLDIEKSWAEMTLRNSQTHEWTASGIDPASPSAPDKRTMQQRLEMIGGLKGNMSARTTHDTSAVTQPEVYEEPDALFIECSTSSNIYALPWYHNTPEPCARMEGPAGALDDAPDAVDLQDADHPYSNHSIHWIFEFSDPSVTADINRGRHRIKRVVGF